MLEVKTDDVLQLAEGVVLHAIPELEKFWAFQIESGDHYELNASAYALLAAFAEPKPVHDGIATFSRTYNLDMNTAQADCMPLLAQYLEAGVFERRNP